MSYGQGKPLWGKGGTESSAQAQPPQNPYKSYQQGGSSYQPPKVTGTFAEQQTQVMEDTMRTHYQTENTASNVLTQLTTQRQQLTGAHDNVWEMRTTTEKAKREISDLSAKVKAKKRKLQMIVAVLAVLDTFLFLRLLRCGGSFFC